MTGKGSLPTFLILGVKKAGTTWIFNLLKSHQQVYVPKYRKEVHFFDWHYEKGVDWYRSFFPDETEAARYKALGEASPAYIFEDDTPDRVKEVLPDGKFIVILRNPVERIISDYTYYLQRGGKNPFDEFSEPDGTPFRMGLYADRLKEWFKRFDRDRFLILLFEECIHDPDLTKEKLADFLEIDVDGFESPNDESQNATFKVRMKNLYLIGVKSAVILRRLRLDYLIHLFKKSGLMKIFRSAEDEVLTIGDKQRAELLERYNQDINELEMLLGWNLDMWRETASES
jgi:hypothetical protein